MYFGPAVVAAACVCHASAASGSAGALGQVVVEGLLLQDEAGSVFVQVNGYRAW